MGESAQNTVTRLLGQMWGGDPDAAGELLSLIYSELHALARKNMAGQRKDHTLQPTALVNEAYIRLVAESDDGLANREQFMELAARAMRRVLVDHARFRGRLKRKAKGLEVALDGIETGSGNNQPEIIDLHNALEELARQDSRMVKIVELRYFGGFDQAETAKILKLSERTVQREWRAARAWLRGELK